MTLVLLSFLATAQKAKLVDAISTSWSGGVAGKYGTGYVFIVEFSCNGADEPMPDTLWIGSKCITLISKTTSGRSYNMIKTVKKKKVTFKVWGGTSNEDEDRPTIQYPGAPPEKKIAKPAPPVKYSGVALLSYKYKEKQTYFVIDKIMTVGPPVNYP